MSAVYTITKGTFRRLVPGSLQGAIWRRHRKFPVRQLIALKGMLERRARHDEIYDEQYFRTIDKESSRAAAVIVPALMRAFAPRRVIDVGCGSGAFLVEFASRGAQVLGLEHASRALEICRERGLPVRHFDLEAPEPIGEWADLAISTEVAEHLPESCADAYVELLCSLSDRVVITAATPGQGGTDHVNEQPHDYWIQKFEARGFRLDGRRTRAWRKRWARASIASCYWRNVMLICRT